MRPFGDAPIDPKATSRRLGSVRGGARSGRPRQLATAETIEATYLGSRAWVVAITRQSSASPIAGTFASVSMSHKRVFGPGRKPIFGGRRKVVLLSVGKRCDQEQFDGECGIGGRLLCAHPVRVDLAVDFGEQVAPATSRADDPRLGASGAIVRPTIRPASSAILWLFAEEWSEGNRFSQ